MSKRYRCPACKARGKTWDGDHPRCGFTETGRFNADNWNCATLNRLRELAKQHGHASRFFDESIAVLPCPEYDDGAGLGHIILAWHKDRGSVAWAMEVDSDAQCPLTLATAEAALVYFKAAS